MNYSIYITMAQQIIDYVWINDLYEMETKSVIDTRMFHQIKDIPAYCIGDKLIQPRQLFRHPLKSQYDIIVLCDMVYINYDTEPAQISIPEQNQRNEFAIYMKQYSEPVFKIIQCYKSDTLLFRQHKQLCSHIGIDIFSKPGVYEIYTEKENVYNYVWMSRYMLYLLDDQIEWTFLNLVPNVEEEIMNKVNELDMNTIDDFDMLQL
jgi:hypothetical protein